METAGHLNLGDGPQVPFNISIFLSNNISEKCFIHNWVRAQELGNPIESARYIQKTRHRVTVNLISFYT